MSVDSPDWSFTAPLGLQTNGALAPGTSDKLPVPAAGCWLVTAQYSGNSTLQFLVQSQNPFNQQYDVFKMGPPLTRANPAGDNGSFLVPVPAAATLVINNPGSTGSVAYQAVFMAGPVPLMLLGQELMASSSPVVIASDQSALKVQLSYDGATPDAATWQTVIASSPYTTTQTSGVLQNKTHRGILFAVNVTAMGTGNVTPRVLTNDPFAGGIVVWVAAAALVAPGLVLYMVYPGASKPANTGLIEVAPVPLGDSYFVQLVKSDGSSWTFAAAVQLLS